MKLNKLQIHTFFLPSLIIFTYVCLFLDTIKYPGFVGNHFIIDARVYLALVIVLLLFSATKSKFLDLILRINSVVLLVFSAFYLFFSILEATHYTNYVLSVYRFHLDGLIFLVIFSLSLFLADKAKFGEQRLVKINNWESALIVLLIVYTLVVDVGTAMEKSIEGNFYIFTHLSDSYDQKMFYQWQDFYYFTLFIKNNTPENSSIVIPPQLAPWWNRSGNANLIRYFVYPRKVIQFTTETIPDVKSLPEGTYILIAWGEWGCDQNGCRGWPVQTINAKEAIFKDPKSSAVKEIKENFHYDPADTSNPFGLLKI